MYTKQINTSQCTTGEYNMNICPFSAYFKMSKVHAVPWELLYAVIIYGVIYLVLMAESEDELFRKPH